MNTAVKASTISPSPRPAITEQKREPLNSLPWGWYLATMAVDIGAAALLWAGWSALPDPVPSQWNFSGQPTAFQEKKIIGIAVSGFAIPFILLAVGVVAGLADHSRQKVHDTGSEADRARMLSNLVQPLLAKFIFLIVTVITLRWLTAMLGLVQGAWVFWGMVGTIALLTLTLLRRFAVITAQVEATYPSEKSRKAFTWGLFYFNPDDDEMFIKSGGVNLPNVGNKYFWVLFAVLFGFTALITALAGLAD